MKKVVLMAIALAMLAPTGARANHELVHGPSHNNAAASMGGYLCGFVQDPITPSGAGLVFVPPKLTSVTFTTRTLVTCNSPTGAAIPSNLKVDAWVWRITSTGTITVAHTYSQVNCGSTWSCPAPQPSVTLTLAPGDRLVYGTNSYVRLAAGKAWNVLGLYCWTTTTGSHEALCQTFADLQNT